MSESKSITEIIRDSLGVGNDPSLKESYVANSKQYTQLSDSVSDKTKDAHTQLYRKYVESLNQISAELDTAELRDSNSHYSTFRSLKVEETANLNAVYLHELYFANCFSPQNELYADSLTFMRLQRDWGNFDAWQRDFIACAMASRHGWAITAYSFYLKRFVNVFVDSNDRNVMFGLYPIIVLDVHEHARIIDHANDKKTYVVAQMLELNWEVIEERIKRCEKIHEAVK